MAERDRVLNVRVSDAEVEMVREIAESVGLSQSDTVRQIIRRVHAELVTAQPTKRLTK